MSLYSFAEASLTTRNDRRRRPAIDAGQIARTLLLLALAIAALVVMHGL